MSESQSAFRYNPLCRDTVTTAPAPLGSGVLNGGSLSLSLSLSLSQLLPKIFYIWVVSNKP